MVDRASRGDWLARRCLQKKQGPSASVTQNLVRNFGSREAAADHVREHFERRFAAPPDPPLSFDDLPVSEPDFTAHEVHQAVQRMKPGKTTGMSSGVLSSPTLSLRLVGSSFCLRHCGRRMPKVSGPLFVVKCLPSLRPG